MSSLPVGTTVKLEGLSSAEYNGKKGRVAVTAQDVIARGRVAVIVDGATLSFKRANVRRYFPSDDSDESDEEDEAAPPPPKQENGGYREETEDDFEDNTDAKEPKGKGTVELASAKHCEGDKGNMILQAQRL